MRRFAKMWCLWRDLGRGEKRERMIYVPNWSIKVHPQYIWPGEHGRMPTAFSAATGDARVTVTDTKRVEERAETFMMELNSLTFWYGRAELCRIGL